MVESRIPKTYEEVLEILDLQEVTLIAGGTDLMVKNRNWCHLPPLFHSSVLFIGQIEALKGIKKDAFGVHIGSMTTLEELRNHEECPKLLKKAVQLMGSPAIRHSGTLGGNIANASPAGDTLPILYALNARLVLESLKGERVVKIEDFIKGPGRIDLSANELLKEILIEETHFDYWTFEKVGGRKADAISKVAFCAGVTIKAGRIQDFRATFGAVGPRIIRETSLEGKIMGKSIVEDQEDILSIVKEYAPFIQPIDDQRSSAAYRKQCSLNLLEGFLKSI